MKRGIFEKIISVCAGRARGSEDPEGEMWFKGWISGSSEKSESLNGKTLLYLVSPEGRIRKPLSPPSHTPTLSKPTIFPECAAYFLCQGGVLDSKFHLMSKTVRQRDYIKEDVEDGGVTGVLKKQDKCFLTECGCSSHSNKLKSKTACKIPQLKNILLTDL